MPGMLWTTRRNHEKFHDPPCAWPRRGNRTFPTHSFGRADHSETRVHPAGATRAATAGDCAAGASALRVMIGTVTDPVKAEGPLQLILARALHLFRSEPLRRRPRSARIGSGPFPVIPPEPANALAGP